MCRNYYIRHKMPITCYFLLCISKTNIKLSKIHHARCHSSDFYEYLNTDISESLHLLLIKI